ncbi:MAG: hypothetical protein KDI13_09215 [Alphaproteobacteria bacterium]|nr:hypothetical protein [Alphaproteobacteria bacterium]
MSVFFHEIGHSLTAWFYGYPSIPTFDFKHGGGLAPFWGDGSFLIVLCVAALLGYGIYLLQGWLVMQIVLGVLIVLELTTFWNEDIRMGMIDFMGPGAVPLVAGFLLWRAVFDLAPRGSFERVLNAAFGFGMIFRVFIDSYGLLYNQVHRLLYYQQKGSHGFGDFDKIASRFYWLDFETVVLFWAGLAAVCLVFPLLMGLILNRSRNELDSF